MTVGSRTFVRLVLHPGHPKCGSSSIQDALHQNAEDLKDRGVYYPVERPNQVFIQACDSQDFEPVAGWLDRLLKEVRQSDCNTLVVSSENLGVRQLVSSGRTLHEIFDRRCQPVDVVYYLRRQDDWMVSMWQQWGHKTGASLQEFVDERLGFHEPGYKEAVKLFEEVYGAGRVSVVPLNPVTFAGGDLISDFSQRTGVGPLKLDDPGRPRNPSMSGFLCSVLARVPEVYDQELVQQVTKGRTDHSVRRLLEREVSHHLLFNRDKRVMSLEERRRILDHFEEDNRELHARFFSDVHFDDIFGAPACGSDAKLEHLQAQVDGLQDVVAMQMQVILQLLPERDSSGTGSRIRQLIRKGKKLLGGVLSAIRAGG